MTNTQKSSRPTAPRSGPSKIGCLFLWEGSPQNKLNAPYFLAPRNQTSPLNMRVSQVLTLGIDTCLLQFSTSLLPITGVVPLEHLLMGARGRSMDGFGRVQEPLKCKLTVVHTFFFWGQLIIFIRFSKCFWTQRKLSSPHQSVSSSGRQESPLMCFITDCPDNLPTNLLLSSALKKYHTLPQVVSRLLFYYLPPPAGLHYLKRAGR